MEPGEQICRPASGEPARTAYAQCAARQRVHGAQLQLRLLDSSYLDHGIGLPYPVRSVEFRRATPGAAPRVRSFAHDATEGAREMRLIAHTASESDRAQRLARGQHETLC